MTIRTWRWLLGLNMSSKLPQPIGGRAAAALRLHRYDVAAADAQHAAERDPSCCRALVRGGRAQLGLRQPAEAASLFGKALQHSPDDRAAQARARELSFTDHSSRFVCSLQSSSCFGTAHHEG